jgi:ComF family protein
MRDWLDAALALLLAPTCAACHQPLQHPSRGCVCAACWNAVIALPEASLSDVSSPDASLPRASSRGVSSPGVPSRGVSSLAVSPPEVSSREASSPVSRLDLCSASSVLTWGRPNTDASHDAETSGHVSSALAIGPYAGALRAIVHALKYDGRRSLAAPLAQRMRSVGAEFVSHSSAAVPVPLHPRRRRERGFNQAADLARHLGLPVVPAIARVRWTPSQTTLHAADRDANVRDAFCVTSRVRELRGTTVIIVDDVRTTGATLEACARVLRNAGVKDVVALTAARVDSSRP